jgi:diacylglycerol O-acyltransferase / wax synthase
MATRIASADLTWLLMDRPNNLMHVNALVGFDTLPDFDTLGNTIMDRMVSRYRVLSQIPVRRDAYWWWEDDHDFALDRHVRRVVLEDGSEESIRAHVSSQFSVPFDRSHPLWEMQLLSGPPEQGSGGFLFTRVHHGIGDGIRLVQMLIGTCDPAEDDSASAVRRVGRNAERENQHPLERAARVVEQSVTDAVDYAHNATGVLVGAGRELITTTNPLGLANHVSAGVDLVRSPVRLLDAVTSIGSLDNQLSNTWRELGRMLLSDGSEAGAWSGRPGAEKSVAWIERFPMDGLRDAARAFGGTLNDVLLGAVSLALTDYLAEHDVEDVTDVSWLMPVSLRPIDSSLPPELGNHFVVVLLSLPLALHDHRALITEVHRRTTRLKNSAQPPVAFGFQQVIAEAPEAVARRLTNFFSGKTIGQLSNVPGPRGGMTCAGAPVRSILGWVPTSGDQPIGICLFSYDGTVNIGVAADARMIPDPLRVAHLVEFHLRGLTESARL